MAKDDLVGNMPTEKLLSFTQEENETAINTLAFESAYNKAIDTFLTTLLFHNELNICGFCLSVPEVIVSLNNLPSSLDDNNELYCHSS